MAASAKKRIGETVLITGASAGIEWNVVDGLKERHASLQGPTLLLWGEDDVTFPIAYAERMAGEFAGRARLVRIQRASLMPHEERPEAVLESLVPFVEEFAANG